VKPLDRVPLGGIYVALDITDEAGVESSIAAAESRMGSLSGLVNAAGILGKPYPPERLRLSDWNREIRVDLTGTYIMARAVGTRMAARGFGVRVNAVSPGFCRSPALTKAIHAGILDEARMSGITALGRLLEASEVADMIIWLLQSGSRGVTGINLPVDAGFLAGVTWPAYGLDN
jgi:NAD(P)-dependent dehydrogenase (short-subunit alcohol dehydrogenase family)